MRPVPALSSKVGKVGYLALCAVSRHVAIETQGGGGAPLPVSPPTGGGPRAKISPRAVSPGASIAQFPVDFFYRGQGCPSP